MVVYVFPLVSFNSGSINFQQSISLWFNPLNIMFYFGSNFKNFVRASRKDGMMVQV